MADPQLDRLLGSLGASFEAQLIRQEEDAAADLAMSLSQDVCLRDELGRCGAVAAILGDGVRAPVRAVGADVIVTTGAIAALVPLGRAVVRAAPGRPPTTSDATFVGILRGWARAGAQVEVAASEGRFLGRLRRCGRDYVVVAQGESDALVALDAIAWVRLVRGDSADVS